MRSALFLVALLGAGFNATLLADGSYPDPHVSIDADGPSPIPITTNPFSVTPDSESGGFFFYQNDTGVNWIDLTLDAVLPPLAPGQPLQGGPNAYFNCATNVFLSCTAVDDGPSTMFPGFENFTLQFMGDDHHFIAYNGFGIVESTFAINLNDDPNSSDPNGPGGWTSPAPLSFTYTAQTPEPASWLLLVSGAGLFGLRKLRARS